MRVDLSKAKIGDKFRTRGGEIATFIGRFPKSIISFDYYVRIGKEMATRCFVTGRLLPDDETQYDLVEQVFDDEKDTTDLEIIEAMSQAIKEIPEKAAEREQELQRRQEVVDLAEKMYIILEAENFKYYLGNSGNYAFESEELMRLTFVRADTFINKKHQYLKEGKL